MYIFKGIAIIAVIVFCCIEIGKLWKRDAGYLEAALLGLATMMAVFNLLCIPMHILQIPFTVLCVVFSVFLAGITVLSVTISIRQKDRRHILGYPITFHVFFAIAMVLIIYQIIRLVVLQPVVYGDDQTYLTMINDIVNSDHIQGLRVDTGTEMPPYSLKYMATSYYPFLAYWCKIFDFHPLLFCKTFLPILTMTFGYGVFWLFAERFFRDDMRKKSMFLLLIALFVEFENISYHFFSRKYLLWPWQGKSILYTILMPLLFYLLICCLNQSTTKKEIFLLAVALFANGAVSLMGVGYSTIIVAVFGIVQTIQCRKPRILLQTIMICIPTAVVLAGAVLTS